MVNTVNNTVLHIQNLLREKILKVLITTKIFFITIYGDGWVNDLIW